MRKTLPTVRLTRSRGTAVVGPPIKLHRTVSPVLCRTAVVFYKCAWALASEAANGLPPLATGTEEKDDAKSPEMEAGRLTVIR